jgi:heme/copper-type cytochrome/quinol oxidase subunit 3
MIGSGRTFLILAGAGCIAASVTHLACIIGGPDWFRTMGAGERMARMVERGAMMPLILTVIIAAILATWAAYAFSAAGLIGRLPLMRVALVAIAAVLIARGLMMFAPGLWRPDLSLEFKIWSSLATLVLGALFAIGTAQAWANLSNKGIA